MWVGRGSDEIDQSSNWAGAVTPKPPVNAKKGKCDRRTDRPTNGESGLESRVHATKKKRPLTTATKTVNNCNEKKKNIESNNANSNKNNANNNNNNANNINKNNNKNKKNNNQNNNENNNNDYNV